jgi:hypothetical protein
MSTSFGPYSYDFATCWVEQELKGNIRVFCRVRPTEGGACGETAVDFPASSGDRGLELVTAGGDKHTFAFDRVFRPGTSQVM